MFLETDLNSQKYLVLLSNFFLKSGNRLKIENLYQRWLSGQGLSGLGIRMSLVQIPPLVIQFFILTFSIWLDTKSSLQCLNLYG